MYSIPLSLLLYCAVSQTIIFAVNVRTKTSTVLRKGKQYVDYMDEFVYIRFNFVGLYPDLR